MATVFSSIDSAVHMVRLTNVPQHVFQIKLDDKHFIAPITGFALELQGNYQFLHTVNEFIYLYTFGDRIGDLVLTGVCFTEVCNSSSDVGDGATLNTGTITKGAVENVFNFYRKNRIAVRNKPVDIQLGTLGKFIAFLVGAKFEQPKADNGVVQWVMRFNTLTPK